MSVMCHYINIVSLFLCSVLVFVLSLCSCRVTVDAVALTHPCRIANKEDGLFASDPEVGDVAIEGTGSIGK